MGFLLVLRQIVAKKPVYCDKLYPRMIIATFYNQSIATNNRYELNYSIKCLEKIYLVVIHFVYCLNLKKSATKCRSFFTKNSLSPPPPKIWGSFS